MGVLGQRRGMRKRRHTLRGRRTDYIETDGRCKGSSVCSVGLLLPVS
jgi:hypothetical protein